MSYIEIDYIEYNKIKIIDFESNEIDKLSKYFPNLELSRVYTFRSSIGNVTTIINIYFKYFNIIIFKQEDDFYTVKKREKILSGSILLETSCLLYTSPSPRD